MNRPADVSALLVLLAVEVIVLYRGQRRLFWASAQASGSRMLAYLLAVPGTILHEGAHYLVCRALGVAVGRQLAPGGQRTRTRLFWPQSTPDGGVVLGRVVHARTDPLRQALIAVAPLVLIPPLLAAATAGLLGPHALTRLPDVLGRVPTWRAIAWCYLTLSCAQAVFPSPGDRVGLLGGVGLATLALAAGWLVGTLGGASSLSDVLGALVGVLAVPAGAAALLLGGFALAGRRRTPV